MNDSIQAVVQNLSELILDLSGDFSRTGFELGQLVNCNGHRFTVIATSTDFMSLEIVGNMTMGWL